MFNQIRKFFTPPVLPDDEDKTNQARILIVLLRSFIVILMVALVAGVFLYTTNSVIPLIVMLLGVVALRVMALRGHIRPASILLLSGFWLIVASGQLFMIGRINSIFVAFHIAITVMAGILLGKRSAIIFAVLSSTFGLSLAVLESIGYPLNHLFPANPMGEWLNLLLAFYLTLAPLSLTLDSVAHSLKRARRSEKQYIALFNEAPMMYVIVQMEENVPIVTNCNNAFAERLGYIRDQVIGQPLIRFYAPQSKSTLAVSSSIDPLLDHNSKMSVECELVAHDGKIIHTLLRVSPEVNLTGTAVRTLVMYVDITERKRTELLLHESEEVFSKLITAIPDIIVKTDLEGNILFINASVAPAFGYFHMDRMLGKNIFSLVSEKDRARAEINRKLMVEKYIGPQEYSLEIKEGMTIDCEVNGEVFRHDDGTAFGLVFIVRDLTEKKKFQTQLLQSQKMEAVGRLAGGVAHDYNNLIGVILGYAEMIRNELSATHPIYRKVQAIISAAERSANLTRQLLAFSRQQVIAPVLFNINEDLDSLQKLVGRLIGEDIHLITELEPQLWNIRIDPTQFTQIITNLATNARDAIANIGSITIKTENVLLDIPLRTDQGDIPKGYYVKLTFSDTGAGIDQFTLSHIFEPFFSTKEINKGTGLGLATVFGIVKQNNGFILVSSTLGLGTIFTIFFPRAEGDADTRVAQSAEPPLFGTETILLVEDDEELLNLSKETLEMNGYRVMSAASPLAAQTLFSGETHTIDLLISDVVMPGMNGKELKEWILEKCPDIKTLFISGYTSDIVTQRGVLDEGMFFLQKPFTPKSLLRKVRDVLSAQ